MGAGQGKKKRAQTSRTPDEEVAWQAYYEANLRALQSGDLADHAAAKALRPQGESPAQEAERAQWAPNLWDPTHLPFPIFSPVADASGREGTVVTAFFLGPEDNEPQYVVLWDDGQLEPAGMFDGDGNMNPNLRHSALKSLPAAGRVVDLVGRALSLQADDVREYVMAVSSQQKDIKGEVRAQIIGAEVAGTDADLTEDGLFQRDIKLTLRLYEHGSVLANNVPLSVLRMLTFEQPEPETISF